MSRPTLTHAFAAARAQNRCALIPFVVAGDPDLQASADILRALEHAGADAIELGIPYSDPLADGPSIVAAGQRALDGGTTIDRALELIASVKIPVVLFTYANPVMQFGVQKLTDALVRYNAAGIIIPDLPLEETMAMSAPLRSAGIDIPLLVAPTTTEARAEKIATASSGFVYLVSRLGVTGAGQKPHAETIAEKTALLRRFTNLPVAVGFGISQAADIAAIADIADGAIIGSALVDRIHARGELAPAAAAGKYIAELLPGTRRTETAAT